MQAHRSFRISDASFRDTPWAVAAFGLLSVFCIGLGVLLESLPTFWSGFLAGAGLASITTLLLMGPRPRTVDVAALPTPSERVRAMCADPAGSRVEAIHLYCRETGLGLAEGKAAIEACRTPLNTGMQPEQRP